MHVAAVLLYLTLTLYIAMNGHFRMTLTYAQTSAYFSILLRSPILLFFVPIFLLNVSIFLNIKTMFNVQQIGAFCTVTLLKASNSPLNKIPAVR